MPVVGLGTWKSEPEKLERAITTAIEAGYRHLDCAWIYGNQDVIGNTLQKLFTAKKLKREDLFITTKIWCTDFTTPDFALDEILKQLKVDYVDQLLIHWPVPMKPSARTLKVPDLFENGSLKDEYLDVDETRSIEDTLVALWEAMEKFCDEGKARTIGISNFTRPLIRKLFVDKKVKHMPATNQVELHPRLPQPELLEFCESLNIKVVAYSPLGHGTIREEAVHLMDEPAVVEIAKVHSVSPAQVLIRWSIQKGCIVIPKSETPKYIKSNWEVFHFELSAEQMEQLAKLQRDDGRQVNGFLKGQFDEKTWE